MRYLKKSLKILATITVVFFLFCCNPIENDSESNSMLIVMNLEGFDLEYNRAEYLQSDVLYVDPDTGAQSVIADTAIVTFTNKLINPNPLEYTTPSHYSSIQVTRYVVTYFRSDGKNTEGVDIPYSFEGYFSTVVEVDEQVEVNFVLVREVAKLEPPLVDLIESGLEGGNETVLEVQARIDFYGHDLANNKVKATGYLAIFFANYAN